MLYKNVYVFIVNYHLLILNTARSTTILKLLNETVEYFGFNSFYII